MDKIEDYIKKLYDKNPSITRDEMKALLKEERDLYRPNKQRWRNGYIAHQIDVFFKTKEPKMQFASKPEIEGKQIQKHVDIFKPDDTNIVRGTSLDATSPGELPPIGKTESNADFKQELIGIVTGLKEYVDDELRRVSQELQNDFKSVKLVVSKMKIEPEEVEYDEIELKKSTIQSIKKICDEHNIDDESDYIDALIGLEKGFNNERELLARNKKKIERYDTIVSTIQQNKGKMTLTFDFNEQDDSLGMTPMGRFGVSLKNMLLLIGIGIGIGVCIGIGIAFSLKATGIILF